MTLNIVIEVIANEMNLPTEGIHSDTPLEKLGVDSLKAITVLYDLEERFKIEIPNEYIEEITTVGDIVMKVDELLAKKAQ
jgi:acyl carrier protein